MTPLSPPRARAALADAGLVLLAAGALLVLALHVLPPSNRVDPWTRTISEYALGANGWIFDLGVLALAAGSVGVLLALVGVGAVRATGAASVFVLLWSAALVVLVVFEKYDFAAGGPRGPGGMIHRMASLVAFLCLPVGALLATRGAAAGDPRWRVPATRARWAAVVSCACLSLLLYAITRSVVADVAWWRVFPLGALERLIAGAEVVTVGCLGWWARRAARDHAPVGTAVTRVA